MRLDLFYSELSQSENVSFTSWTVL